VAALSVGKPAVEIEVDEATGRWFVDGLAMILVPQHFFLNNHFAVEAELGPERLAAILAPAGHRSAYAWCEHEAARHQISGDDVFKHYMHRLSQRGWGQFEVMDLAGRSGRAAVKVTHSVFVTGKPANARRKLCAMFAPWIEGALQFVARRDGASQSLTAREVYCAGEGERDHCLFAASPVHNPD
jgi:predicted hydrocarbon binding protein